MSLLLLSSGISGLTRTPPCSLSRTVAAMLADERAASIVEYAIVASAFGVLMIGVLVALGQSGGQNLNGTQTNLANESSSP